MQSRKAVLAATLCCSFHAACLSQPLNIHFEHLSIDQGLSNATVTAIVQDRPGFLWIGTEDGLNRYDGYGFTVFKHNPEDTNSVNRNDIGALAVDSAGILWIGTWDGVDKFDEALGLFVHLRNVAPELAFLHGVTITSLTFDDTGLLWIATMGAGVAVYNPRTGAVKSYRHDAKNPGSIPDDAITSLHIDGRKRVWIGTYSSGVTCLLADHVGMRTFHDLPGDAPKITSNRVTTVTEDDSGRILAGTFGSGLCRYDERNAKFVNYSSRNGRIPLAIFAIAHDTQGRMWLGSFDGGISIVQRADRTMVQYKYNASDPGSVSSDRIHVLVPDRSGSMWAGSWKGGLNVYQPYKSKFEHFAHEWYDSTSLSDNTVWSICEDRGGTAWVGTELGGLNRYDPLTNRFVHYTHNSSLPKSISSNIVKAICEDSSGMLWIAASDKGIDRIDRNGTVLERFRHDPNDPASLGGVGVGTMFFDRDNDLWIGGGYLDRYEHRTGKFIHYDSSRLGTMSFTGKDIQSITQDSSGMIWLASFGWQLFRLDAKANTVRRYPAVGGTYCLHTDRSGVVWIGSFGKGLFRYNPATDDFDNVTESDGLSSNFIKGIVSDEHENLWLSTSKGLSRYDVRARSFRNYDPSDGVQAYEFRTASVCKGRSGKLYFGGVNGFNAFYPGNVIDNPVVPPVVLTNFRVFDKPYSTGTSTSLHSGVTLSYSQDFFSFEFVALNFTSPEKNRYAYKLEGFDRDWIACGIRRYANYTHLDGGEYVFRVRASNNDNVWNEEGASMRIVINPPYWRTWWFLTAGIAILSIAIYSLYRVNLSKAVEVERTRAAISSDLHDDIGTSLTRIALFSDLAKREARSNTATMTDRLDVISDISRSMLDQMNDIVWSINPDNDTLQDMVYRMEDVAVKLFDAAGIEYHISVPRSVPDEKLSMTVRRNGFLVFKELVNNVIKHARCTRAEIDISFDPSKQRGMMTIVVTDDGRGFDAAKEYPGNGLKNIRMRSRAIGGTLTMSSGGNGGARSTLVVPLRV